MVDNRRSNMAVTEEILKCGCVVIDQSLIA